LSSLSHRRKNKERGSLVPPKGGNLGGGVSPSTSNVILRYAKSTISDFDSDPVLLRVGDWSLPGNGQKYEDCGMVRAHKCPNGGDSKLHPAGVDGRPAGVHIVEYYKRSCFRAECPICFGAWAGREAEKADYRLRSYKGGRFRRPIHVIASPPCDKWGLEFGVLRSECYKNLRKVGVYGGCVIIHPFREVPKDSGNWVVSPHFHIIGYGWVHHTKENFEANGWVVKVRKGGIISSVKGTLSYQLGHSGVHKGHINGLRRSRVHTITWFGVCSYNKLRLKRWHPVPVLCPICGCELRPVHLDKKNCWRGLDPPKNFGLFYLVGGTWVEYNKMA
jgi:hypothetical protein